MSLGTWDPEGCLVCSIDDPAEAVRAVAALQRAGFTAEHIRLFLPDELLALNDAHRYSALKRVFFFLTNLSDDGALEEEYREQARCGHPILVVHAPQHAQHVGATALLRDYRAHTVKYYGPWTVRGFD
jgi:hypothetical protein